MRPNTATQPYLDVIRVKQPSKSRHTTDSQNSTYLKVPEVIADITHIDVGSSDIAESNICFYPDGTKTKTFRRQLQQTLRSTVIPPERPEATTIRNTSVGYPVINEKKKTRRKSSTIRKKTPFGDSTNLTTGGWDVSGYSNQPPRPRDRLHFSKAHSSDIKNMINILRSTDREIERQLAISKAENTFV